MTIRHSKCELLMKKKLMLSTTKLNRLQEFEKCISLIMDKMYIKEELVYNENSGVVRLARKHWRGQQLCSFWWWEVSSFTYNFHMCGSLALSFVEICSMILCGNQWEDWVKDVGFYGWWSFNKLLPPQPRINPKWNHLYTKCVILTLQIDAVFTGSDLPHLIKTVRNSLENEKRPLWVCLLPVCTCKRLHKCI